MKVLWHRRLACEGLVAQATRLWVSWRTRGCWMAKPFNEALQRLDRRVP